MKESDVLGIHHNIKALLSRSSTLAHPPSWLLVAAAGACSMAAPRPRPVPNRKSMAPSCRRVATPGRPLLAATGICGLPARVTKFCVLPRAAGWGLPRVRANYRFYRFASDAYGSDARS